MATRSSPSMRSSAPTTTTSLLYTPTSSFTAHPYQLDKMPYDPRELSPVTRISNTLVGLVVPASLNVSSVADLMAMIKAQPGKLNYSTATGMTDVIYDGYFKSASLADHARALSRRGGAAHRPRRKPHPGLCGRARDRAAACPGRPRQAHRASPTAQRAPNLSGYADCREGWLSRHSPSTASSGLFGPRAWRRPHATALRPMCGPSSADQTIKSRFIATSQLVSPGNVGRIRRLDRGAAQQARRDRPEARHQGGAVVASV